MLQCRIDLLLGCQLKNILRKYHHSLRSKHFREANSEERGFQRFASEKNGAKAKNRKEGVGEGSEGNACGQTP